MLFGIVNGVFQGIGVLDGGDNCQKRRGSFVVNLYWLMDSSDFYK